MPTIKVEVKGKIAINLTPEEKIVCGNEDYEVDFQFGEPWANVKFKTGLFIFNGDLIAVPFGGNVCPVPIIKNTTLLAIGVKSSDGLLYTTTPAYADCFKSAEDLAKNKIPAPTKDVYDQIMELLNKALAQGTAVPMGGAKGQVLAKKSDEDYDTHWVDDQAGGGGIPEDTVREIVREETANLQTKTDEGLETQDKTIVGAINELNAREDKQGLTEEQVITLIESRLPTIEEEY